MTLWFEDSNQQNDTVEMQSVWKLFNWNNVKSQINVCTLVVRSSVRPQRLMFIIVKRDATRQLQAFGS